MSESLRRKIIFATLPLALAWAAFNMIGKKASAPVPAPAEVLQSVPSSEPTVLHPTPVELKANLNSPWGRDPFQSRSHHTGARSAFGARPSTVAWALAGIIHNHQQPLALINNRMVGIGDRVDSATVVAIDKESVTLEYQGRQIKLKLSKG